MRKRITVSALRAPMLLLARATVGSAATSSPGRKAARRTAEGKSVRDIQRDLKGVVARQLFKLLERCDRPAVELTTLS